jgi:hypothetical protein
MDDEQASAPRTQKKMKIKYEGESHDVIDNKGPIFLSHDMYDK